MNKGLKKGLTIGLIVLAVIIGIMVLVPFLFKDKIKEAVVQIADENLNAKVAIGDFGLNLFSNFPSATLTLKDMSVVGLDAFASDTLLKAKETSITINLFSLFGDNYKVSKINLEKTSLHAKITKDGAANWDIVKSDSTNISAADSSAESNFSLSLNTIDIKEANIIYEDLESNIVASLLGWNGKVSGDFSANETTLKTKSAVDQMSIAMDGIPFLSNVKTTLDAELNANFDDMKFTFIKSSCMLNDLVTAVDGSVRYIKEGEFDFDLKLQAPGANFKQILSLVPAMYNDDFKDVKTAGDVSLSAYFIGEMKTKAEIYPALDFRLTVSNGMFQYPSLPKAVENINLILSINGDGGSLDNIMVLMDRFSLSIGGNPIKGNFRMTPVVNDRSIKLNAEGKLNLAMIKEVYPLPEGTDLNGNVEADLRIATTEGALKKEQYNNTTAEGFFKLTGMTYKTADMPEISIKNAVLEFTPQYANLKGLEVNMGKSDIKAEGRLENFIAYALKDQLLKGQLTITSKFINLDEIMGSDETQKAEKAEKTEEVSDPIIIPKNIDFSLNAALAHVLFNDIDLTNISGAIRLHEGTISMQNLSINALKGQALVNGSYNTANEKSPIVDFNLDLTRVSFAETFKYVETVKEFAPIFEDVIGTYSMKLKFDTKLGTTTKDMLNAFNGSGNLMTSDVKMEGNKALTALGSALKTDKLNSISPKDLNLFFTIEDGALKTDPFVVHLGDGGEMTLEGITKLDQSIDYKGTVKLPTSLDNKFVNSIPLTITGSFSKPKIGVDVKAAVTDALGSAVDKLLGKDKVGEDGEKKDSKVGSIIDKISGKDSSGGEGTKEERIAKVRADAEKDATQLTEAAQKVAATATEKAGTNILAKAAAKKLGDDAVKRAEKEAQKIRDRAEEKVKEIEAEAETK